MTRVKAWVGAGTLAAVAAFPTGCGLIESADSSGCAEESRALAERMAEQHQAAEEPFCSYGTTWRVLANGDEAAFDRVLAELESDGWQEKVPVEGVAGRGLESPAINESIVEASLKPYIAVVPERYELQLNAGSRPA